jgi:hypothetical protein
LDFRLIRQPSGFVPILMSLVALAMIAGYVVAFGATSARGQDEGTAARLFQLLMAAQLPIIAWFAIRWLPRAPAQALAVLALQAVAALVPIVTIVVLEGAAPS